MDRTLSQKEAQCLIRFFPFLSFPFRNAPLEAGKAVTRGAAKRSTSSSHDSTFLFFPSCT